MLDGIKTIRSSLAFLVSIVYDLERGLTDTRIITCERFSFLRGVHPERRFWGDKTQGIQVPVRVRLGVHHVVTRMIHFLRLETCLELKSSLK